MPLVAFLLLGAWLALRDRPLAAGAALGVATLVKLNGTYGLAAILLLLVGRAAWERRENGAWPRWPLRWGGLLIAGYLPTWFVGLWLLDLWVGTYHTPWEHLSYMLRYGFALTRPGGPANDESYPWQWLINEVQMTYYRVDVNTLVNGKVVATRPQVYFRGAMNPVIIGAASLGFWYAASRAWRYGERLSIWVVAWTIATYLPFYPISMLEHRTSYIFYFLPTIPAVCVGLALLLREAGLPRTVMWGFLLAALIGFIGYFPFRTIL
jgi:predicted membrane-bound dolichyl-phosphate-mannose-protein mannosyltransferase